MVKTKLGFFSFTCCEGCTVVFIESLNKKFDEWTKKVDIVNMRALRSVKKMKPMDIAFVEGAISTESEIRKLKKIRENCKMLVTLGSGSINGYPSDQRNKFSKENKEKIQFLVDKLNQIPKISPVKEFVKVDDEIPGCPVDENLVIKKIEGYLKK